MNMKEQCKNAIYYYAPQERQNNAALLDEYTGYVGAVIILLKDNYERLKEQGETEWFIPDDILATLEEMKPY